MPATGYCLDHGFLLAWQPPGKGHSLREPLWDRSAAACEATRTAGEGR